MLTRTFIVATVFVVIGFVGAMAFLLAARAACRWGWGH